MQKQGVWQRNGACHGRGVYVSRHVDIALGILAIQNRNDSLVRATHPVISTK